MREFPSISDYNKAVENKFYQDRSNIFFPILKQSGELHFEPGGRAVVYKVQDSTNNIKAIKLFTVNRDSLFKKYNQISKFIQNFTSSKYFVEFQFKEKLIYCSDINSDKNDNIFPGLIMKWAEGKTLGSIVKNLCEQNDKTNLKKLSEKFKELSIFIIDSDFAHGDLKHDNIIVNSDLNVKLIDYDGVYIPDFKGQKSSELGTPSFQHLKRTNDDFNVHIDDFSILSIYTSLLALAKYPNLYEKYEDQQNLLFRLEDFENPKQSEIFHFFDKDTELAKWSYLLKKTLGNDHIYIPELKNYLNGGFPKPSIEISHFPDKILSGKEVELKWNSENTDEVLLNNKLIDATGILKVKVLNNSLFIFKLKNKFETIEIEHKVNVLPVLNVKEFKCKHQKIEFGKETSLVWNVENAKRVELHCLGNMEVISNNGEKKVAPTENSTYKLVVTALDGKTIFTKETIVRVYHKIQFTSFTTNLHQIPRGVEVELSWNVEHAENLILRSNDGLNEKVSSTDIFKLFPTKSVSYWLEGKNDLFNAKSNTLRIEVDNAPQMSKIPSFFEENQIPLIDLKMPELQSIILDETQLEFEKMIQPKRSFSISKTLNSILRK